jgi:hypothetical protein
MAAVHIDTSFPALTVVDPAWAPLLPKSPVLEHLGFDMAILPSRYTEQAGVAIVRQGKAFVHRVGMDTWAYGRLREGDRIMEVNGLRVADASATSLQKMLHSRPLAFRVRRGQDDMVYNSEDSALISQQSKL